jgi:tetratricopeptide (TPR) repeat protein
MNATQIQTVYQTILKFLGTGQLKNAFEKTRLLVDELQIGEFSDRLNELQLNYHYLLHYYVTGVEDPERKTVYNKLIAKTFVLNSELMEELLLRNSSNYEFTQKRYFPYSKRYNSLGELLVGLKYYHSQSALLHNLSDSHEVEIKRLRSNYETALNELFSVFWLATKYQSDEKLLFTKIMNPEYPGWLEKTTVISALTLNLWRSFDELKLSLLFDLCQHEDLGVKQRALVAVCFILAKYNRFLPFFPIVRNRLVLLADDNHVVENFQNIIIQIIATAETDKISKKMQEEILPEVMKISPKLTDRLDEGGLTNNEELNDENPQWQDMLEESGVSDKLKELGEMQLEGADVYMSTFSMLKSFPFFSEISHWFLPFDGRYSAVNELFKTDDKSLLTAFVSNNVMCNSDKYSFCLSILQMPESQRGMLKQSFKGEAEQLDEMSKEESMLTPDITAKNISKQYIQDLFRFFKLYHQHADFQDMFSYSLMMHRSYLFDILSANGDFKTSIAEYYFAKSHYNEALDLFEQILHDATPTSAIYQKIGYSYQQANQYVKALDAYLKADMIQPDDLWTIRKIALCYRMSGNYEKALEYYQYAEFLKPDNKSLLMQIGHCFMELGKMKEALAIYFKLDALEEDDVKVWRAISWCSFVSGNIVQADYYVQKIIENEPSAQDYLNAGHIAWCQRRLTAAIAFYNKSLNLMQDNKELFIKTLLEDKSYLLGNGVGEDEIPLLIDAMEATGNSQ